MNLVHSIKKLHPFFSKAKLILQGYFGKNVAKKG